MVTFITKQEGDTIVRIIIRLLARELRALRILHFKTLNPYNFVISSNLSTELREHIIEM